MTRQSKSGVGAEGMAARGVNLDALIPRADLAIGEGMVSGTQGEEKLGITHFQPRNFFMRALRKPEFQRETTQWTPTKIVDLISAFLDRRLIPAVILWRAGDYNFVVDGAHRLSALMAWVYDDYGDGELSKRLFGPTIAPEQLDLAQKTRKRVNKEIGKYALFDASLDFPVSDDEEQRKRIGNLSQVHFIAQWVPAATKDAAEDSFFKINDAATPLDPTEKRILRSRESAASIASRAIAHGGRGYTYWGHFDSDVQETVVDLSGRLYDLLYTPPLPPGRTVDTLDVPVAGKGYSTLPFVFDLVNLVNATRVADSTTKGAVKDKLEKDTDGSVTVAYLKRVYKTVSRITGKAPTSIGIHPVVYFHNRGGAFSPWAFLAWAKIVDDLFDRKQVNKFCDIRPELERYLIDHKWAMSQIIHTNGSGHRSTPWLERYWRFVLERFIAGDDYEKVANAVFEDKKLGFLKFKSPHYRLPGDDSDARFSKSTVTAAIWDTALPGAPRCHICGGLWHRNSYQGDHKVAKRDGGDARLDNAGISHPYCNSAYKDYLANRARQSVSEAAK